MRPHSMDYLTLTEQEHELAVSKYMQEHGLFGSEHLPFNTLPFRQIVVMLRYLQACMRRIIPFLATKISSTPSTRLLCLSITR